MKEFELSKARYQIEGEGQPILLIGGQFATLEGWNATVEDLQRFNKVIILEYPNQGQSEMDLEFDNLKNYAEYTLQFLKAIDVEPEELVAFGISFGANIIKCMTFDFDIKFKAAILTGVTSTYKLKHYMIENYKLWIDIIEKLDVETAFKVIFLKLLSPEFIEKAPEIVEVAAKQMVTHYGEKKEALICILDATINYLNSVTTPGGDLKFPYDIYIIGARSDTMMPINYVREYAELVQAKFFELPGGHLVNMEQSFELMSILHDVIDEYEEY